MKGFRLSLGEAGKASVHNANLPPHSLQGRLPRLLLLHDVEHMFYLQSGNG